MARAVTASAVVANPLRPLRAVVSANNPIPSHARGLGLGETGHSAHGTRKVDPPGWGRTL